MASILEETPNDAGTWLTIEENDGARLQALIHGPSDTAQSGVSVYWPARRAPEAFRSFFDQARPRVDDVPAGQGRIDRRLIYLRDTGDAAEFTAGDERRFQDFDFLRFEFLWRGEKNAEHPVLVVWANLDAGTADPVPPDAAGVLLQPRHLESLDHSLATLIAKTSAQKPDLASIVSMLAELAEFLRPRSTPLAAAAH